MARLDIARRVKRKYLDMRIRMRYGTTHPAVVKLADGFHEVRIDPTDPRARKKIASDGIRRKRRRNQVFWVAAVDELQPDVAIDIGVNFGECLFQADYPPETQAFGIDGNPDLLPFLQASRELHPQGPQIEVLNALVAEKPAESASFFVSQKASGGSTAVSGVTDMREGDFEEKQVPVTSIDTLLNTTESAKRIVFKIDVEGFEGQVLRGMEATLSACKTAIGFIEFDTRMLTRAGEDMEQLWQFLQDRFEVHMFVGSRLVDLSHADWSVAKANCKATDDHTDLVLIGGKEREAARSFTQTQFGRRAA
ncbi:MAG: FkbM family methyltransferase [Planctomycetaceae bacterium]